MKKVLYWSIISIIGLFFLLPHFHFFSNSLDEGAVLNGAFRIFNNQQLYQDFPSNLGPATLHIYASVFKIFGPSYVSAKTFTLFFLTITTLALYVLAEKFLKQQISAIIMVLLWLLSLSVGSPLVSHNSLVAFSAIITFSTFYWNQKNKRLLWIDGLVGVMSAFSVLLLVTRGLAVLLSIIIAYIIYNNYQISRRLLIVLVSTLTTLVTMTLIWGNGWWLTPLLSSESYLHVVSDVSWMPLIIFLIFNTILFAISYRQTSNKKEDLIVIYILSILLLLSTANLPDIQHIIPLSFTTIIFFVLAIKNSKTIGLLPTFIKIISSLGLLIIATYMAFSMHKLATRSASNAEANILKLTEIISDEDFLAYPFGEYYYFVTKKTDPLDISLPDFYAPQSPYLKLNTLAVLNNPPGFILTQDRYLERYNLDDPFETIKKECYELIQNSAIWSLYKIKNECEINSTEELHEA
jgi:hypothetical protein